MSDRNAPSTSNCQDANAKTATQHRLRSNMNNCIEVSTERVCSNVGYWSGRCSTSGPATDGSGRSASSVSIVPCTNNQPHNHLITTYNVILNGIRPGQTFG